MRQKTNSQLNDAREPTQHCVGMTKTRFHHYSVNPASPNEPQQIDDMLIFHNLRSLLHFRESGIAGELM